jgi:hypothetical protein
MQQPTKALAEKFIQTHRTIFLKNLGQLTTMCEP